MDTVRNRIKAVLEAVEQMIYSDRQPVISVKIAKADYHFEEEFHREGKDFRDFGRNETWGDRKSTRLNSSHRSQSRMPSSA